MKVTKVTTSFFLVFVTILAAVPADDDGVVEADPKDDGAVDLDTKLQVTAKDLTTTSIKENPSSQIPSSPSSTLLSTPSVETGTTETSSLVDSPPSKTIESTPEPPANPQPPSATEPPKETEKPAEAPPKKEPPPTPVETLAPNKEEEPPKATAAKPTPKPVSSNGAELVDVTSTSTFSITKSGRSTTSTTIITTRIPRSLATQDDSHATTNLPLYLTLISIILNFAS